MLSWVLDHCMFGRNESRWRVNEKGYCRFIDPISVLSVEMISFRI